MGAYVHIHVSHAHFHVSLHLGSGGIIFPFGGGDCRGSVLGFWPAAASGDSASAGRKALCPDLRNKNMAGQTPEMILTRIQPGGGTRRLLGPSGESSIPPRPPRTDPRTDPSSDPARSRGTAGTCGPRGTTAPSGPRAPPGPAGSHAVCLSARPRPAARAVASPSRASRRLVNIHEARARARGAAGRPRRDR